MAEYQAIYKCRLCGKEFVQYKTDEHSIAKGLVSAMTGDGSLRYIKHDGKVHIHVPHSCSDGSFGFSDFCGFRKVE